MAKLFNKHQHTVCCFSIILDQVKTRRYSKGTARDFFHISFSSFSFHTPRTKCIHKSNDQISRKETKTKSNELFFFCESSRLGCVGIERMKRYFISCACFFWNCVFSQMCLVLCTFAASTKIRFSTSNMSFAALTICDQKCVHKYLKAIQISAKTSLDTSANDGVKMWSLLLGSWVASSEQSSCFLKKLFRPFSLEDL